MKQRFTGLPWAIQLAALVVGLPLLLLGLALVASHAAEIATLHSISATSELDLVVGLLFALVGASFLWPLRRVNAG